MSLLDRIGKQAQRVREERAAAEREKQRLEDRYEQIVAPAMEGLHDYLQALSRDLGEVQPPVQLHYQLIHYGPIVANALHEYRIEKHKRRFGYEITMAWRARVDHEKSNEQRIHGHRRVKQLIDQLRQRGVPERELPMQAPFQLQDCGWVANRWCELLGLPLEMQQRLMALDNPLVRLELVGDILQRQGIGI